jgi:hypothetical protein
MTPPVTEGGSTSDEEEPAFREPFTADELCEDLAELWWMLYEILVLLEVGDPRAMGIAQVMQRKIRALQRTLEPVGGRGRSWR